jgi:adenylate cyclase
VRRRLFSYPLSLAVVVASLIAITGGWIAWWNYQTGVANVRELAGKLFEQIARETAGQTEAFLQRAPPAAQALAGLAELDPPAADRDTLAKRFLAILRANPQLKWVSYSTRDGEFLGVYRTASGVRVNHSVISSGATVLDEYDVDDAGGWTLARHEDDTRYDPRTRPFYQLAAATPDGVWTQPYVFEENVPGITYAQRVPARGDLAGVLTIDFELGRLSALARELQFSARGRVAIVSGDGIVIAHPNEPVTRARGSAIELVHASELADPVVRVAVTAGPATTELELHGDVYLMRSIAVRGGGAGWRVIAYAPESDFTAAMRGRVVSSLAISAITLVLAIGIAWLLARLVSGPLTAVAQEMVNVGQLRLEAEPPARPTLFREIDMMNTALSRMKGGLRSFARYVPRDLVRTLVESGHDADLVGEVRELTVYFSDLAGFTTLAETKTPDELVRFLSEYFDDMSSIIATERGTVDKYLGDGIMAFWGAPVGFEDHAVHACRAALRCRARVHELSARGATLATRIGVATGDVLVGNIGSTERINYTVMGDTANLASRLEGLNKQYGTDVMISEATYNQAASHVVARPIDVVAVKGKSRGVRVYELLAMADEANADAVAIAAAATRALAAYLERRFSEAVAAWDEILALRPDDRASQVMRERALRYVAAPPPADWTGLTVATEK